MKIYILIKHDKLDYHIIGAYKNKDKAHIEAYKLNQESGPIHEDEIQSMILDVTSFYDNIFKKKITKEEALQLIDEFTKVRYHVKCIELQ